MGDPRLGQRLIAAARVARWELTIETAVFKVLEARAAAVIAAVQAPLTASAADAWAGFDTWEQDIDSEVAPVVQAVLSEAAATVIDGLGARGMLNVIDVGPRVAHLLAGIRGIGPGAAEDVAEQLTQGAALGESIPKLTARVRGVLDASRVEARRIARTETLGAVNGASNEMAGELFVHGIVTTKTWLATNDDRTRPDHADADGQTVAFDQPYDVGGEEMMYPHDEGASGGNVWNCRCTETYE